MQYLNYHHLHYFWHVAREGSIRATSEVLHVTPSTISGQISQLEEAIGQPLFRRAGAGMTLTDLGEIVFGYAEEIFSSGRELQQYLARRSGENFVRLEIGVLDAVPKMLVRRLVESVVRDHPEAHVIFHEGREDELTTRLTLHQFDMVLTDSPMSAPGSIPVHNERLGDSSMSFFAAPTLAKTIKNFPDDLEGAPLLLPQTMTVVRRRLDRFFVENDIHPRIAGEFEDTALMKAFGDAGAGLFPAPTVIEDDILARLEVEKIGVLETVREEFYLVSASRHHAHPAFGLLVDNAKAYLES